MPAFFSRAPRRGLVALSVLLGISSLALVSAPSQADDSSTLTVVGTSDVYDSNLVQSVLKPGFEAAYPQYKLNYVSKGTGAAIAYAEAGTASALIVHAASLENQFVASGYSHEKYGRAIFWGDYVLLGPSADPAHVMTSDKHDIVGAFQKIAAAGASGQANFVSRGGTPGTTVAEHAIWALTSGVTTCAVSADNGGGTSPSTTGSTCPASISYPSWYHATGLTQGPNLTNADACNYSGGPGNCYVLTDRGTYQYLVSTHAISNLGIVTRDNSPKAPGGQTLLVNSFHAYAVDPAKFAGTPSVAINLPAATAFLDWVTSAAGQKAVGSYLNSTGDAPFLPDAAPALTAYGPAARVTGGGVIRVHGRLSNVVPGTPSLSGITVRLRGTSTSGPKTLKNVAEAKTNAAGAYVLSYRPTTSRGYSVFAPAISKVENAALTPVFGDLLASVSKPVGVSRVVGVPHVSRVGVAGGVVSFTGRVAPRATGDGARLSLYGAPAAGGRVRSLGSRPVPDGHSAFTARFRLSHRTWKLQLRYTNVGKILGGSTATHTVRVR